MMCIITYLTMKNDTSVLHEVSIIWLLIIFKIIFINRYANKSKPIIYLLDIAISDWEIFLLMISTI